MAVGKAGRYRDWPEGDELPKTWEEWEELKDEAFIKAMDSMAAKGNMSAMQFVLHVMQQRESKRNEGIIRCLMWATVIFTAISAVFVGLSTFGVI